MLGCLRGSRLEPSTEPNSAGSGSPPLPVPPPLLSPQPHPSPRLSRMQPLLPPRRARVLCGVIFPQAFSKSCANVRQYGVTHIHLAAAIKSNSSFSPAFPKPTLAMEGTIISSMVSVSSGVYVSSHSSSLSSTACRPSLHGPLPLQRRSLQGTSQQSR